MQIGNQKYPFTDLNPATEETLQLIADKPSPVKTRYLTADDILSVDVWLVGGATNAGYTVNGQPLSVDNFFIDGTAGNGYDRVVTSNPLDNCTLQRIRIKLKKPEVLSGVIINNTPGNPPASYGFKDITVSALNGPSWSVSSVFPSQRDNAYVTVDIHNDPVDEFYVILNSNEAVSFITVASFKHIQIAVLEDFSQREILTQLETANTTLAKTGTALPTSKIGLGGNTNTDWFADEDTDIGLTSARFYDCPRIYSAFVSRFSGVASTKPVVMILGDYGLKVRDIYIADTNYYGFAGVKVEGDDGNGYVTLFDDTALYPEGTTHRINLHIALPVNNNTLYRTLKITFLGTDWGDYGGGTILASWSRIEVQEVVDDAADQNRQLLYGIEAQQTSGAQKTQLVNSLGNTFEDSLYPEALVTQPLEQARIHEGKSFYYNDIITLGSAGVQDYLITTPALETAHFSYDMEGLFGITLEMFEASDKTGTTLQTSFDFNRATANTSNVTVHKGTSGGTTDGTRIVWRKSGSGPSSGKLSGNASANNDRILAANTKYIFRITSAAASNDIALQFNW